jgi:2-polyprenyl-6-methoxyphenol hydroxylase-like FAD-dependent oxidoreductase
MEVVIVGGGIGGLTLGLALHRCGIASRVHESAPRMRPVGVGINLLPPAVKELAELGLLEELARRAVTTREAVFYNRFGQLIYREPLGRAAGYAFPQLSIHRADLHEVLAAAFRARAGEGRLLTGWRCTGVEQDGAAATARFRAAESGEELPPQRGDVVVGCDGIHSAVRRQLHPAEGPPLYSGINMWRGVTRWPPFLSGASMVRAGWFTPGKMVIYPVRERIDAEGRQLVNWVAEIATPRHDERDWSRPGRLEDFIHAYEDWHFDWLDVPAFIRAADLVLEFPMVDQDPLPWWSRGRVTLLGDAAHPMVPRGSNGAGQAIVDARVLADELASRNDPAEALAAYEARRLEATARIVRMNRENPPDAILREVYLRTGDRPFARIEDVIAREELEAISESYKRVAGQERGRTQGGDVR